MEIKYSKLINKTEKYAFAEINKKVNDLKQKGIKVIDFGVGDPKLPNQKPLNPKPLNPSPKTLNPQTLKPLNPSAKALNL